VLDVGPRSEERPALLRAEHGEENRPAGPLAGLRGQHVRLRDVDDGHRARRIVIGAVEDLRAVPALVIVMRRDDHHFLFELRIRTLQQADNAAVRHDVTVDADRQRDLRPRNRQRSVGTRCLGRPRQLLERAVGAADQNRGERRRNLHRRNPNLVDVVRKKELLDPRRLRRPIRLRGRLEVRHAGMVVDVGDEQNADRAVFLRREHFTERHGGFGGHQPVERAGHIALARLVVEDQRNLSLHPLAAVVVIGKRRRGDAEAGEDHRTCHARAGAEPQRIVVLTRLSSSRDLIRVSHLQRIVGSDRRNLQVEALKERPVRSGRHQTEPLEPRLDELGRERVSGRADEPALRQIVREEVQVGLQILFPD
jgi:hypothetical protein